MALLCLYGIEFSLFVSDGDTTVKVSEETSAQDEEEDEDEDEEETIPGCTLFIKNLNFTTTEDTLKEVSHKQGVESGFCLV